MRGSGGPDTYTGLRGSEATSLSARSGASDSRPLAGSTSHNHVQYLSFELETFLLCGFMYRVGLESRDTISKIVLRIG